MIGPETILLLIVAGCAAGFVAGFFGVGGGVLLVPILLYLYSVTGVSSLVSTHLALGTSLFVVMLTTTSSALRHHRNGQVVLRAALIIGSVSALSAFAGSLLAAALSGRTLERLFSVVLAAAAVRLLAGKPNESAGRGIEGVPVMIGTGAVTGIVSALTGVGGGVVSIPLMHGLLGFPMKKAIGTSSAAIVLTATAAAIGYLVTGLRDPQLAPYAGFTLGYIDYVHALPLAAGTIPSAILGASVAHRTGSVLLTRLFAVLMLVVAGRIFFG